MPATSAPMIHALESLCQLMAAAAPTVEQVVASLGEVEQDWGMNAALVLRVQQPDFASARLFRAPETGAPEVLTLLPATPQSLPVSALVERFGAFQNGQPGSFEVDPEILFYPAQPTLPHRCVVVAAVTGRDGDLARGWVRQVSLRRDLVPARQ